MQGCFAKQGRQWAAQCECKMHVVRVPAAAAQVVGPRRPVQAAPVLRTQPGLHPEDLEQSHLCKATRLLRGIREAASNPPRRGARHYSQPPPSAARTRLADDARKVVHGIGHLGLGVLLHRRRDRHVPALDDDLHQARRRAATGWRALCRAAVETADFTAHKLRCPRPLVPAGWHLIRKLLRPRAPAGTASRAVRPPP